MYKIAVAGTGYVGLVSGACFAEKGQQVICVDVNHEKVEIMKKGISPIFEPGLEEIMRRNYNEGRLDYTTDYSKAYSTADIIIIGVGTPEKEDGSANLEFVYLVAKQIAENISKNCIIIIKSTVPVGTNDKIEDYIRQHLKNKVQISIVSNPEFLAQGRAVKDTLYPSRIIIGIEDLVAKNILEEIYKNFNAPILFTNRRSAEMIKYASNDFLALKISYINDIANACELVGANIDDVAKGMSFDSRIGDKFLHAGCGYGGSCFPKDTKALYHFLLNNYNYELKTIKAAIDINENQKQILFYKAKNIVKTLKGLNVAILGVTFKAETDDLREAPSLTIIPMLLNEGAKIVAYDPVGLPGLRKIYSTKINYVDNPILALKNADLCFIFTEWETIKNLKCIDFQNNMNRPLVFDGRNIYSIDEMEGIEYHSIGRSKN